MSYYYLLGIANMVKVFGMAKEKGYFGIKERSYARPIQINSVGG